MFQYFTILPKFAFQLGNRPFDLLYTIFYLARQNSKQVKEKGYFTVSFRAIQQRLDLPDESKTLNPSRDIRQPIEDAVADITKQLQAAGTEQEFIITAVYDDRANIREYLDNGYLKIELRGLYAQPFIERASCAKIIAEAARSAAARKVFFISFYRIFIKFTKIY